MKKKKLFTAVCTVALAAATIGLLTPKIIGSLDTMQTNNKSGASVVGDTVTLKVSSDEIEKGDTFKLTVDIGNVPDSGINFCEFAVSYDSKVVTVSSVKSGSAMGTIDENELRFDNDAIYLGYASADSSIKESGTILEIEGTSAGTAKAGDVSVFKIEPIKRPVTPGSSSTIDNIFLGYLGNNTSAVTYNVSVTDGSVEIIDKSVTTTSPTTTTHEPLTTIVGPETTATNNSSNTSASTTSTKASASSSTKASASSSTKASTSSSTKTSASSSTKTSASSSTKTSTSSSSTSTSTNPTYLKGDLDSNGKITVSDLVILQQYIVNNKKLTANQYITGDLNGDTKINIFDVMLLRKLLLS